MRKNQTLGIILLLFLSFKANSQISLGVELSPSLSNFLSDPPRDFHPIYTLNYGVKAEYSFRKISISAGIVLFNNGKMEHWAQTTPTMPEGTGEEIEVYSRATTITFPVIVDYSFLRFSNTDIFAGIGCYNGFVNSETIEIEDQIFDVNYFDNYYLGLNIGVGLKQSIGNKVYLKVRPNFLYQIRKDNPGNYMTYRMISFSLDLGCYIRL